MSRQTQAEDSFKNPGIHQFAPPPLPPIMPPFQMGPPHISNPQLAYSHNFPPMPLPPFAPWMHPGMLPPPPPMQIQTQVQKVISKEEPLPKS